MKRTSEIVYDRAELEYRYNNLHSQLHSDLASIRKIIEQLFENAPFQPTVTTRVKSFNSLYAKILKKKIKKKGDDLFSSITDIIGVRIICTFLEEVQLAEHIIQDHFSIVERKPKGTEQPEEIFGYKSTHLLVNIPDNIVTQSIYHICEIQIRTILQEAWSEVEHELVYKPDFKPYDEPLKRKLAALNANLTLSDIIFQEIRDYQSQLQIQLNIRRESFLRKVSNDSKLLINNSSLDAQKQNLDHSSPNPSLQSVNRSSKNIDALLLKGLIAHNRQQYEKAVEIYSQILCGDIQPSIRAIILIHRGMAFYTKSDFERSMQDFCQAIKLDPLNARARFCRGVINMNLKHYKEALIDFDSSISIGPGLFDYYYCRAQVNYFLGFHAEAIRDCDEALNLNPSAAAVWEFKNIVSSQAV